jgi:SAM-dependent methyltransferase
MDTRLRQLDPAQILDAERFMQYEGLLSRAWTLERLQKLIDRPGMAVCDVGGATGRFLDELARSARFPIRAAVLELDERYRAQLARPDLDFVHGSILENDLPADRFDVVTFQHVLHHLVSDSARATRKLQEAALAEVVRITRPGGHILFEEEVNRVKPFSRLVYELSRLANRLRLRWRYFEAGTVVVHFLTPEEIEGMVQAHAHAGTLSVLERGYVPWDMPWRWRLTVLMSRVGSISYLLRKRAAGPAG